MNILKSVLATSVALMISMSALASQNPASMMESSAQAAKETVVNEAKSVATDKISAVQDKMEMAKQGMSDKATTMKSGTAEKANSVKEVAKSQKSHMDTKAKAVKNSAKDKVVKANKKASNATKKVKKSQI